MRYGGDRFCSFGVEPPPLDWRPVDRFRRRIPGVGKWQAGARRRRVSPPYRLCGRGRFECWQPSLWRGRQLALGGAAGEGTEIVEKGVDGSDQQHLAGAGGLDRGRNDTAGWIGKVPTAVREEGWKEQPGTGRCERCSIISGPSQGRCDRLDRRAGTADLTDFFHVHAVTSVHSTTLQRTN